MRPSTLDFYPISITTMTLKYGTFNILDFYPISITIAPLITPTPPVSITITTNNPHPPRSDDSEDEIDDHALNQILIVTQSPTAQASGQITGLPMPSRIEAKHPGGDRTGDFLPRSKMTADLAKVINDGLYYYEQDLWEEMDDRMQVSGRRWNCSGRDLGLEVQ
jgi:hypothetical protein